MIDPARTCIALGPLALYLLVIGVINVSRRPFVTTGSRDLAALGVGVSGLVLIGPLELFTSTSLVLSLGIMYWVLILGLFASGCLMAVLHVRPRLVIYNTTPSQLSTPLIEAAKEIHKLKATVKNLESRFHAIMNEKAEAIRHVKARDAIIKKQNKVLEKLDPEEF